MKRVLWSALFCALSAASAAAEPYLRIVQPYENASLPAVNSSFVFGSVRPATAVVTINGVPVTPHANGGFLVMIPFVPGKFEITAVAADAGSTTTVVRTVTVASPTVSLAVDSGDLIPTTPRTRVVLRPGDFIEPSFQGAPGGTATFRFTDDGPALPMQEKGGALRGVYQGVYQIRPEDRFDKSDIVFTLKRADGKKISKKSGADITIQRRTVPRVIELMEDSVVYTGPGADFGYNLFLLKGTRLEVTGEWGDYLRIGIGDINQGWIRRASSTELPSGTPVARSISRNARVGATADSTLITIPLQYRHAFRVDQVSSPHRLKLTLYGVIADTDRIRYLNSKSVVEEINWAQTEPSTTVLDIRTTQSQPWGYDVRYEGTTLVLEIRHRPSVGTKALPLKGMRIAVDAGHSTASFGTIGPWGNTEAAINLMAAKVVKQELEKRGAEVVMIQDGTKDLSLQDRVMAAWNARAHLYVSIHCDACPEGQNPREVEGFSVHYYHPQSHAFAKAVHDTYGKRTGFRDQGLWRSNLAVCRPTQMPAILLEQAFLILPEFEATLLTPAHHKRVADSITAGVLQFYEESRP